MKEKTGFSNLLTGGEPIVVIHEIDLKSMGYLAMLLIFFLVAQKVISKI